MAKLIHRSPWTPPRIQLFRALLNEIEPRFGRQADFAKALGRSPETLSRLENGHTHTSQTTEQRLNHLARRFRLIRRIFRS